MTSDATYIHPSHSPDPSVRAAWLTEEEERLEIWWKRRWHGKFPIRVYRHEQFAPQIPLVSWNLDVRLPFRREFHAFWTPYHRGVSWNNCKTTGGTIHLHVDPQIEPKPYPRWYCRRGLEVTPHLYTEGVDPTWSPCWRAALRIV